jgi:hypothetical protein
MQVSATSGHPSSLAMLIQILPILFLAIPFLIMNGVIAKRKGRNPVEFVLLSLIPLVGMFITLWLVSLSDISVIKEIEALKAKIAELDKK